MLTRVTIHVEEKNLHFCKVFTDEETLTKECDEWLDAHDLNDGCSGFTEEEEPALNAILAEKFDDPYNLQNSVICEDISESVLTAILDVLPERCDDGNLLREIANRLQIDCEGLDLDTF